MLTPTLFTRGVCERPCLQASLRRLCSRQRTSRRLNNRLNLRRRRRTAQAPAQPESGPPLRVYIHAGLKTHAEGQHDYPQFLADWSKLLTNRGAIVDGGLHFPSARELAGVDVLVIYKGDAGYLSIEDRATLDAFLRRGGGLVSLHDALCGPDPEYFAGIVGGAKKHGEVNYTLEADVAYTIVDTAHPIMQGMTDFTIKDEAFFLMTWAKSPEINVLAIGADGGDAERRHAQGRSRAADLDLRARALPGPASAAVPRVRLDAGPQLRELRQPADPADAAARHRVGGQAPGRRADDRAPAAAASSARLPAAPTGR